MQSIDRSKKIPTENPTLLTSTLCELFLDSNGLTPTSITVYIHVLKGEERWRRKRLRVSFATVRENFWKLFLKKRLLKRRVCLIWRERRPATGPEHAGMTAAATTTTTSNERVPFANGKAFRASLDNMRRNAKCQHVRSKPSNMHAHPATVCTRVAKTARTYWWGPSSPSVFFSEGDII